MGNKVLEQADQGLYSESDYSMVSTTKDPKYGEATIIKNNKTQEQAAIITKMITNQQQFETRIQQISFRKNLIDDNVVRLINYTVAKKDEFCSTFWKINLLYEYLSSDLQNEIDQLKKNNLTYAEQDIWYIIKSCVSAISYLRSKGIDHGDVRPSTLLVNNNGQIKLSENFVYQKTLNGYQQLLMELNKDVYLSPEFLTCLKERIQEPQLDSQKCDVFQIGLTALEATLLNSVQNIYDMKKFEINADTLRQYYQEISKKYSNILVQFIEYMLALDPSLRPGLDDLNVELNRIIQNGLIQVSTSIPVQQKKQVYVEQLDEQIVNELIDQKAQNQVRSGETEQITNQGIVSQQQIQQADKITYQPESYKISDITKKTQADAMRKSTQKVEVRQISPNVKQVIETTEYVQGSYQPVQHRDYADLYQQVDSVIQMSKQTIDNYSNYMVNTTTQQQLQSYPQQQQPITTVTNDQYYTQILPHSSVQVQEKQAIQQSIYAPQNTLSSQTYEVYSNPKQTVEKEKNDYQTYQFKYNQTTVNNQPLNYTTNYQLVQPDMNYLLSKGKTEQQVQQFDQQQHQFSLQQQQPQIPVISTTFHDQGQTFYQPKEYSKFEAQQPKFLFEPEMRVDCKITNTLNQQQQQQYYNFANVQGNETYIQQKIEENKFILEKPINEQLNSGSKKFDTNFTHSNQFNQVITEKYSQDNNYLGQQPYQVNQIVQEQYQTKTHQTNDILLDKALDEQIQKSLKRSKEIEDLIKNTKKIIQSSEKNIESKKDQNQ